MRLAILLTLALALAACGDDDGGSKPTCTSDQTKQLTSAADLSKLLATAVDQASKDALTDMVASRCCQLCPAGSATQRPLLEDTEACIKCAGGYSGGNPADHVEGCAANVCKSN
jgi:cytochrome c5